MDVWHIYNSPTKVLVYNDTEKTANYYLKEGLEVSAAYGRLVLKLNGDEVFSAGWKDAASEILFPTSTDILDLVRTVNDYLISTTLGGGALGGFGDYTDFATTGTPISITGGAGYIDLTNDTLGASTNELYLPAGVTTLWDQATNRADLSELSIGDTGLIRVDLTITTSLANTEANIQLEFGSGTVFDVPIDHSLNYKTVGTYRIAALTSFYIGNNNVKNNGFRVRAKADKTSNIVVNGFLIEIKRRS